MNDIIKKKYAYLTFEKDDFPILQIVLTILQSKIKFKKTYQYGN